MDKQQREMVQKQHRETVTVILPKFNGSDSNLISDKSVKELRGAFNVLIYTVNTQ